MTLRHFAGGEGLPVGTQRHAVDRSPTGGCEDFPPTGGFEHVDRVGGVVRDSRHPRPVLAEGDTVHLQHLPQHVLLKSHDASHFPSGLKASASIE